MQQLINLHLAYIAQAYLVGNMTLSLLAQHKKCKDINPSNVFSHPSAVSFTQ